MGRVAKMKSTITKEYEYSDSVANSWDLVSMMDALTAFCILGTWQRAGQMRHGNY